MIQNLLPFSTHLAPFFSARVFIDTTSEPEPGSLMANAPMCSPEISCSYKHASSSHSSEFRELDSAEAVSVARSSTRYLGQILGLLRLGAIAHDLIDAEVRVGAVAQTHTG